MPDAAKVVMNTWGGDRGGLASGATRSLMSRFIRRTQKLSVLPTIPRELDGFGQCEKVGEGVLSECLHCGGDFFVSGGVTVQSLVSVKAKLVGPVADGRSDRSIFRQLIDALFQLPCFHCRVECLQRYFKRFSEHAGSRCPLLTFQAVHGLQVYLAHAIGYMRRRFGWGRAGKYFWYCQARNFLQVHVEPGQFPGSRLMTQRGDRQATARAGKPTLCDEWMSRMIDFIFKAKCCVFRFAMRAVMNENSHE